MPSSQIKLSRRPIDVFFRPLGQRPADDGMTSPMSVRSSAGH